MLGQAKRPAPPLSESLIWRVAQQCPNAIFFVYGFLPDTIWNDPMNGELKQPRKEANVLYQDDKLWIPDRREKQESKPTDATRVFRRKDVPEVMRVVLLDSDDQPRGKTTPLVPSLVVQSIRHAETLCPVVHPYRSLTLLSGIRGLQGD